MTTPERRQQLYSEMLRFMRANRVNTVPLDIGALCARAGVELVPLSQIVRETGLTEQEVFSIWGNRDGAVNAHGDRHRIAYHDGLPAGRVRFTICEELAHMVYGHTADAAFNIFSQAYDAEKYAQYDEEARLGAGLLVCPPKFYYTYERFLTPRSLAEICQITLPCARVRQEVFIKYRDEIERNMAYQFAPLPQSRTNLRAYEAAWRRGQKAATSRQDG
ncbi:ImmA/IrrE family metallo-endopeptidase [Lawsonibacter faecis]|uniref:ImmA/IrrE family metallo-endopeptidase n=1 Tax=Lawsonibacter faecis TaxID=2763052 RepID=A0A8J6JLL0_9FIRM|nr:ImmA/IrrE family metallo-endopeptidase [Lawsonibacter faecis]MBC5737084.1 ImmA/IrrE family metallo-endopeptidase [Lawsonibacter faecis]